MLRRELAMYRRPMGIVLVAVAALAGWGWLAATQLPTLAIHATSTENRATAYLFLSVDCPISRQFVPPLNRLYAEYGPHGIQFLGVYPGADSPDALEQHRREFEIAFPVTLDPAHEFCHKFGATHTPQAIVVGDAGAVLYSGRIDGSFADLGRKRITATRADLGEALRSIVAGREIEVAQVTRGRPPSVARLNLCNGL